MTYFLLQCTIDQHTAVLYHLSFFNELSNGNPRSHSLVMVIRCKSSHSNFVKNHCHKLINILVVIDRKELNLLGSLKAGTEIYVS